MIARYSRKELTTIWSEENKYKIWLDVEIAAAQAMEKLGQIPRGVSSCLLYTSPSPRDGLLSRMPSSA